MGVFGQKEGENDGRGIIRGLESDKKREGKRRTKNVTISFKSVIEPDQF